MHATCWSDYLCPWCYAGLDRTVRLRELGVEVSVRPYQLHPEMPPTGWPVQEGRGRRLYDRIAAECEAAGMPFTRPNRIPNSRLALASSEWVRENQPNVHPAVHQAIFDGLFASGLPIDDPDVLRTLLTDAGADGDEAVRAAEAGELDATLARSRDDAIDAGATGAPSWLLDDRLLIAGLQPPEFFERMVGRLRARPRPGT